MPGPCAFTQGPLPAFPSGRLLRQRPVRVVQLQLVLDVLDPLGGAGVITGEEIAEFVLLPVLVLELLPQGRTLRDIEPRLVRISQADPVGLVLELAAVA